MLPVYILSGGRSSRFGSDKAIARIDGAFLIVRLYQEIERTIGSKATIVTSSLDCYSDLGIRLIADPIPHKGPVAGVATALRDSVPHQTKLDSYAPTENAQLVTNHAANMPQQLSQGWCLIVPCDLLEWHPQWLIRLANCLVNAHPASSKACCFNSEFKDENGVLRSRWNPFPGLYHETALPIAKRILSSLKPSMQSFLNDLDMNTLPTPIRGLPAISTANTVVELNNWKNGKLVESTPTKPLNQD